MDQTLIARFKQLQRQYPKDLKEEISFTRFNEICDGYEKQIAELQDKLHRRNMQIKELKRQLELLRFKTSETNYGEFKDAMEQTGNRNLSKEEKERLFNR